MREFDKVLEGKGNDRAEPGAENDLDYSQGYCPGKDQTQSC